MYINDKSLIHSTVAEVSFSDEKRTEINELVITIF